MKTTSKVQYWVYAIDRGMLGYTENYEQDKVGAKTRLARLERSDRIRETYLVKRTISDVVLKRHKKSQKQLDEVRKPAP